MTTQRRNLSKTFKPFLYILPAFTFLAVFTYFPVLRSFYLGFFHLGIGYPVKVFAGLQNYADIFSSATFRQIVLNTALYSASTIVVGMSLGLFLAVQVNKKLVGDGLFKIAIFYPVMIPLAAAGLIWLWIYTPSYGLLDYLLKSVGLPTLSWLDSTETALWSMVAVGVWKHTGYYMILYLAGLQNVSGELLDAAKMEGAGSIRCFWSVTFPMLSSYTLFIFIINVVDSLRSTDLVYIMTQGGPAHATNLIVYYIYQQSFRYWNIGMGSALTSVLVLFLLLCVISIFMTAGRKVYYEA